MLSKEEQLRRAFWLISEASRTKFFGRIVLVLEAGNIVHVEKSQGIKLTEVERRDVDGSSGEGNSIVSSKV